MKIKNIKDVDGFFKVIDSCAGKVELITGEGDRIGGIWLYPMIVFLFVNPILDRIIYKKTKNPYIMPIISAIIITMMCIANTTIILGGAPVVANNY